MRKFYILLLCFLCITLLSSCATTEKYDEMINSLIGSTEQELIHKWGIPAQVYVSGDMKYLEYHKEEQVVTPELNPIHRTTIYGRAVYATSYWEPTIPMIRNYYCTTTFEIQDGKIVSCQRRGNNCVAD